MLELRASGTLSSNGKTLTGYAAVFNSETSLKEFSEVIRQGAFTKSLASGSNIRALYHHDSQALLGTTKGGTLQLREDDHGLAFTLALPDTTHGKDLAILVDRGDVQNCSFAFRVRVGGDRWEQRGNQLVRELLDVDLSEITLTADPAYQDTTVALRSLQAVNDERNFNDFLHNPISGHWLETCMQAGRLKHRLMLQARETTRDPDTGDVIVAWVNKGAVFGKVEPLSARDFIAAGVNQSKVTARITIRYRPDIAASWRILHRGKIYTIDGILPDKDSGLEYLTLPCGEGVHIG